ncbi:MAG: SDR family NAD(P)-dependent oxidoreductase [Pseudanabaenales cyanobacterium]|nr:SDR family NAD(P)-dependent oxidoreductase [Pseudanabaenales cyanobacterium]
MSYTAPSEAAQARVIRTAQLMAEVTPETITYVETHGTGTPMGDPIEVAALKQAFSSDQTDHCAIGSVKTNIGHLDAAAGIAGLIKTVLALHHKVLPPSLHFETPNPQIDFANSPFYVNASLAEWSANGAPRRAGVSSFGFGGTNAHVVLEEAPLKEASPSAFPHQLLLLSAKTQSALEAATTNLISYLQQHPELNLADVAYTLQVGRRSFSHRRMVVCQSINDAIQALQDPKRILTGIHDDNQEPEIAFLFPGLGTQYVNMGRELYQTEPVFRESVDCCCDFLTPLLGKDLRELFNSDEGDAISPDQPGLDLRKMLGRDQAPTDAATQTLNQTEFTQPALFVIEYALAQLWRSLGIRPAAMIGYSLGEYVAATLAEVMSLEAALTLIVKRSQLIQTLPHGAMLAVSMAETEVRALLNEHLSISAISGSHLCVVAGAFNAVEQFATQLQAQGIAHRKVQTSHAFHSHMMQAIAPELVRVVKTLNLKPPKVPYISNVTGTWITAEQATDPGYWAEHLCQPVRFADGIQQLWRSQSSILLEVGPGQTLGSLALQHLEFEPENAPLVLTSLRHAYERQSDIAYILNALGQLWLSGVRVDWQAVYRHQSRYRLPLPTYPFERQRYWIDPPAESVQSTPTQPVDWWTTLVEAGQHQAMVGVAGLNEAEHQAHRLWLDRLCVAYLNQTFRHLGGFKDPSDRRSPEEICNHCRIIPRYQELVRRWLHILVEQDQLQQDEQGRFSQLQSLPADTIPTLLDEVRRRSPDTLEWIDIYQRYGEKLPVILTGEREPLEFHFSMNLQTQAAQAVPRYPTQDYYKPILQAIIEQVVQALPANVSLRILELGAGTGTATEAVLPLLPPHQTHYTFTDVGGLFLQTAQQMFSAYPFIDYRLFDIERSPESQGFNAHEFDLIIAFNVLHVARDLDSSLGGVRSLLAPGGLLLLWEITQARLEADLMDAVLMNPIADPIGQRDMGDPFLSPAEWRDALTRHGFEKVAAFSEFAPYGEHVIAAQVSPIDDPATPVAFTAPLTLTKPTPIARETDLADWFYAPSWRRSLLPKPYQFQSNSANADCWLLFLDQIGVGHELAQRLIGNGAQVIIVEPGTQFELDPASSQGDHYFLNPGSKQDYDQLFQALYAENKVPTAIAHFWSLTPLLSPLPAEASPDQTMQGFYSLLFLAQALIRHGLTHPLPLTVISNHWHSVIGQESISPEKAMMLGALKVLPQEYPQLNCRSIDLDLDQASMPPLIDALMAELQTSSAETVIAYRGGQRWVQTFEPVRLEATPETPSRLRQGGVYLITGGLGELGLTLAEHFAKTVNARLALMGRSAFPDRETWSQWLKTHDESSRTSRKIRKLLDLEALGAEVLVVSADVSDITQLRDAISLTESRFGSINGVIHAAGVPGALNPLDQIKVSDCELQFQTKVRGTALLAQALQDNTLDFCLLMSSLASILGGAGLTAYTTANRFMDAFACQQTQRSKVPWISVNWDTWQTNRDKRETFAGGNFADYAFTADEGIEALRRILFWNGFSQIIVSTAELQARLRPAPMISQQAAFVDDDDAKTLRPRPNLKNAYVAPNTDLERKITVSFQTYLGVEPVGLHDSFFTLGGDSLTGSILINQLREAFHIDLPVRALFEAPTVAELALVIEAQFIEELEALTDEEVAAQLQHAEPSVS